MSAAEGFEPQVKGGRAIRRSQQQEDRAFPEVQPLSGLKPQAAALDELDPSEKFRSADWKIVLGEPVAAHNQAGFLAACRASHYAMSEQSPLSQVKRDLTS